MYQKSHFRNFIFCYQFLSLSFVKAHEGRCYYFVKFCVRIFIAFYLRYLYYNPTSVFCKVTVAKCTITQAVESLVFASYSVLILANI